MSAQSAPPVPRFKDVTLPIDFEPIGIKFKIVPGMSGNINTIPKAEQKMYVTTLLHVPDADNRLAAVGKPLAFVPGTSCIIDGAEYRVVLHAGNGTFGATCVVARTDPGGQTETRFALKEQELNANSFDIVKEAMANYFFNLIDDPVNPFFPKIYKMFRSNRSRGDSTGDKMYILTDLLAVDGYKFLRGLNTNYQAGTGAIILYNQLAAPLKELYEKYEYNHGDLKANNVMFDHDNRLRLIDFGFTRVRIGDVIIHHGSYNKVSNRSQDLTQMAATIRRSFPTGTLGVADAFIENIDIGYGCKLSEAIDNRRVMCMGPGSYVDVNNMDQIYKHCDKYENPNGTFDAVLGDLIQFGPPPLVKLRAQGFIFNSLVKPIPGGGSVAAATGPPAALRILAAATAPPPPPPPPPAAAAAAAAAPLTPSVVVQRPPPRTIAGHILSLLGIQQGGAKLRRNKKTRRNSKRNAARSKHRKSRRL